MALKPMSSITTLLTDSASTDRLTLIEPLGFGGQAEVWLARDQVLNRLVTVKKVAAFAIHDNGHENERLNSLRARVDIEHPAIPTLLGVIPNGDQSWIVSEYVEGIALSELLGELSLDSVYAIAKDLLSALRCLERLSLVHGDLSPNNVVIDGNGQVRLLDFESCSRIGATLSSSATIGFSAPERHARRAGLPAVDTWSAGAILIWLVTQRTPEIILDDAKQPVSVTIGKTVLASDQLGDVINVAAAATRLDPSLRPSVADLLERLSLSYRWLEPVNRSTLATLVQSRLASKRNLGDVLSTSCNTGEGQSEKCEPPSGSQLVAAARSETSFSKFIRKQGWVRGKQVQGKRANGLGLPTRNTYSSKHPVWPSILATILFLAVACVSFLSWEPRMYSVEVDTARLSPATALPGEFSRQWIQTLFSSALPDQWSLLPLDQAKPMTDARDASTIAISVYCEQGACEILAQHERGDRETLAHTLIMDTSDERIWRAAIMNLAQSIASE